jgi:hypothetical protein
LPLLSRRCVDLTSVTTVSGSSRALACVLSRVDVDSELSGEDLSWSGVAVRFELCTGGSMASCVAAGSGFVGGACSCSATLWFITAPRWLPKRTGCVHDQSSLPGHKLPYIMSDNTCYSVIKFGKLFPSYSLF